jgi:glutamine cyclotransferase
MKSRWLAVFVTLAGLGILARRAGLVESLRARGEIETRDEWERLGESPDGSERYPPQGMAFAGGSLYVTNHWNGRKSELYHIDPESGAVMASATMPPEATHTSGLTWADGTLWAVDHTSNVLYRLDAETTFIDGDAAIEERYNTGLRGSSGLTAMRIDGVDHVAVSDFVWTIETTVPLPLGTGRTFIAPLSDVRSGQTVREAATVAYDNGGYSQGLTWDGEYLYESANNFGIDRIEVVDVTRAVERNDSSAIRHRGSFEGPANRIEDIGTDGSRCWTTDEGTYSLYRLEGLDEIRDQVTD